MEHCESIRERFQLHVLFQSSLNSIGTCIYNPALQLVTERIGTKSQLPSFPSVLNSCVGALPLAIVCNSSWHSCSFPHSHPHLCSCLPVPSPPPLPSFFPPSKLMLQPPIPRIVSYSCKICGRECLSNGGLTRHKKSMHPSILPPEEATQYKRIRHQYLTGSSQ